MLPPFLKKPVSRFLLTVLVLYLLFYFVYNVWIHPGEKVDLFVIDITISLSRFILEAMGYTVFTGTERVIGVDGTGGLWIGDNCNGITLFILFAVFVMAYKGNVKTKLIFIILGILSLQLLNVFRVVGLAILDTYSRAWTEFNHTYTFNIIIYGYIFFLWMLWVNKYAGINTTSKT